MWEPKEPVGRAAFLKTLGGLFAIALIDRPALRSAAAHRQMAHHSGMDPLNHPDPRPGINADRVLPVTDLGTSPKNDVLAAYDAARKSPEIFDGLACGCGCSEKGAEHRSLLVCYETKQPTGCLACQMEAKFVAGLVKDGKPLAEIRIGVDKKFG